MKEPPDIDPTLAEKMVKDMFQYFRTIVGLSAEAAGQQLLRTEPFDHFEELIARLVAGGDTDDI